MALLKQTKVKKMTTLFADLDDNEVLDKVMDLADEFEVVEEGSNYFVAYVDGGWLPNPFQTEGAAYRGILAEVIGEERKYFNS